MFKKILILSLILSGCVYFNTFYNAEQSFEKAVKIIEQSQDEDDLPSNAKNLLSDAITNSNIVIEKYPDSKYIDDAFYIIGKASFYKMDNTAADRYFNRLINEFPDSPYRQECEIWLAYTHYRKGLIDSALSQIQTLVDNPPKDKDMKYILYKVMGEIELTQDSIQTAFTYFETATKFADTDSKRMSIFNKLLLIAEKRKDYPKAIYILEQIELYGTSAQIRQEAKMKWIEYNRVLGNYNLILTEIEILLLDPEYDLHHLPLELEKGKIALAVKDYSRAREYFVEILENSNYRRKDPTAEACYHLGNLAITDGFDLEMSIMYLDSVSRIFSASLYKRKANTLKTKINKYQNLLDDFDFAVQEAKEMENAETDTVATIVEIPADDTSKTDIDNDIPDIDIGEPDDFKGEPDDFMGMVPPDIAQPDMRNLQQKQSQPDSLLFTLAEMLLFEFNKPNLSKRKYEDLMDNYSESHFAPQSLYVLTQISDDESKKWTDELLERFPLSIYARQIKGEKVQVDVTDSDPLDIKRDTAWFELNGDPEKSRDMFRDIAVEFDDPESQYFAAYITDKYLYDLENTINEYHGFLIEYPDHSYAKDASSRLEELKFAVRTKMDEVVGWVDRFSSTMTILPVTDSIFVNIDNDSTIFLAYLDTLKISTILGKEKIHAVSDTLWKFEIVDSTKSKFMLEDVRINSTNNTIHMISSGDTLIQADSGDSLVVSHSNSSLTIYPSNDSLLYQFYNTQIVPHPELDEVFLLLGLDEEVAVVDSIEAIQIVDEVQLSDSLAPPPNMPAWMDSLRRASEIIGNPIKDRETGEKDIPLPGDMQVLPEPPTLENAEMNPTLEPDAMRKNNLSNRQEQISNELESEKIDLSSETINPTIPKKVVQDEQELSEYVTKYGDNLKSIAREVYSDENKWQDIYYLNKSLIGDDPHKIYPYHRLYLSGSPSIKKSFSVTITLVVQEGESLWSISEKMYGDPLAWMILYQDNMDAIKINKDLIRPGMVLKIRSNLY
ncbi:MAG: outer membrane protein assembly factor BamD [Candidatus Marinimicrobia bacterium]|jgi:nucleoid-associated protein YgaU/outer membrane protein assembly factor BamD (BamD/ComL family)|nr:outer membrane protein assembly factor BamD [Candidatus Neomarinimicrobiota bacterium]MBT3633580.1 outer membrane protein assembly factor BamD [Candidatus Neomarinimicrobiota bacterium]MBT3682467.1 outer membrane protein assembly factor BamD [Candidatus Neomarinimicrobiota bacterium]MBT3759231.1 outer membrane protein assembly factor BamD [Candidatus Neomarinimicrobiota bacterium]MBT3895496.1 outer membrane protein assembly factor BamD [Candidatus Neomarinimicrobiota bacterium]